jgi:hypothetical protein
VNALAIAVSMKGSMKNIVNFIGFQAAWFAAVFGAAKGVFWAGPMAVLIWLAVHLRLSDRPRLEVQTALASLCLGLLIDSTLIALDVYTAGGPILGWPVTPVWMLALWVNFGTLLNASLAWLKRRYLLAAFLGFLGGPAAYYSGHRMGALTLQAPLLKNMVCLGLSWALAAPLLFYLNEAAGKHVGFIAWFTKREKP